MLASPLPTCDPGLQDSLHGSYDVSQTFVWHRDSYHTYFRSALPITSHAWLQSVLAWALHSPPELKTDIFFSISTGNTGPEFTGIPQLGSSAFRQKGYKEFHWSPQREWAPSLHLNPSPCNPTAGRVPPTLSFPDAQLCPAFVPLWTSGFLCLFLVLLFREQIYFPGTFDLTFSVVCGTAPCAFFVVTVSSNQTPLDPLSTSSSFIILYLFST